MRGYTDDGDYVLGNSDEVCEDCMEVKRRVLRNRDEDDHSEKGLYCPGCGGYETVREFSGRDYSGEYTPRPGE